MNKHIDKKQAGFTVVELLIATAVFSLVLMVCAVAIIYVGRMYYKGTITNRTQVVSRKLGEDVSQAVQFGVKGSDVSFRRPMGPVTQTDGTQTVTAYSLCLGTVRYTYTVGLPLGTGAGKSRHVMWKDRVASLQPCDPLNLTEDVPTGSNSGQEMLGERMRIAKFNVVPVGGLYGVDLTVSFGEDDGLFEPPTALIPENFSICKGVTAGGQFCAVSMYKTTVGKRL